MEPVYMMLGHACGLAAAMSLERGCHLHDLPADKLQTRLIEQKQIIDAKPFDSVWPFPRPAAR
jgi:hypothetical protein